MTPREELAALGAFYGVAVERTIAAHGASLDRYAEWVLGRDDLALVTLGDPDTLRAHPIATARMQSAVARWPSAITGIKLELAGAREPTLYVRVLCPWADGVAWLEREVGDIARDIPPARTLYGLGFQGDVIKTYALAPDGFVSYRLDGARVHREHKDYRADVAWDDIAWPDARWTAIGALGRSLGFDVAGHVGQTSESRDLKVYVERVGAIRTDRSVA